MTASAPNNPVEADAPSRSCRCPRRPRAAGDIAGPVLPASGREELRDFFFASISGMGRGARRRYHQIVPAPMRNRRSLLLLICVATFGLMLNESWSRNPPSEIPLELRGAWATTTKSYADRGFWIGAHQVAFRVGPNPDDVEIYTVTRLKLRSAQADTSIHEIDYAVDGGSSRWSVRHVWLPRQAITFVHQPQMTWTLTPDAHPPIQ